MEAKIDWNCDHSKNISQGAQRFVKDCLTKITFLRLTPKEALFHPWIKGVSLDDNSPISNSPITRVCSPPVINTFTNHIMLIPVTKSRSSKKLLFSD
jgi:serine/threonine protein kinase